MRGVAAFTDANDCPLVLGIPIDVTPVEKSPATNTFDPDPMKNLFDMFVGIFVDVPEYGTMYGEIPAVTVPVVPVSVPVALL
jgi:hypothetical protein